MAGELVDRFFDTLTSSVDNVTTIILTMQVSGSKLKKKRKKMGDWLTSGDSRRSSMKQPKPDKLVVMLGIPMTVHSAGV